MAPDRNDKDPEVANKYPWLMNNDTLRFWMKEHRTPIASATASVISTAVAFPLDFAKSRMQSFNTRFLPTVKDAYKAEGFRGFWCGVGPPLISVTVVRTFSFSIYQKAKYNYSAYFERYFGVSPLATANAPGRYPDIYTITCFGAAGATAGALVTVVACPFELVKLHAQLAGKMSREKGAAAIKTGAFATAKRLVNARGLTGLYSGYRFHLVRDTIGTTIYFSTYESAKQLLGNAMGNSPTSPLAVMVGGGLCGIFSWAATYPIDVAKTVYQKALLANTSGEVEVPKIQFFQPGSYRGLGVSVGRSCLINMIFFSGFEFLKKQINRIPD